MAITDEISSTMRPAVGVPINPVKEGEQEKAGKTINKNGNRASRVGPDQLEPDAQRDQGFEYAEEQPD